LREGTDAKLGGCTMRKYNREMSKKDKEKKGGGGFLKGSNMLEQKKKTY